VPDISSKSTITLVAQLNKLVHRHVSEEQLGLRWRHFMALSNLTDRSPIPQQLLCESIFVDPNNCVLLLNELESLGYVERTRDAADRRRHLVALTPLGAEAFARAQQARASVEDELLKALDPEERRRLHALLVKAHDG